jgi:hypothetical protein
MAHDCGVGFARFAALGAPTAVEQACEAPARQRAKRPIDLGRLRETGWHAYNVEMLVPQQLASRAFDVADSRTPGGALQMDDGAKERIPVRASGNPVHVDRIE